MARPVLCLCSDSISRPKKRLGQPPLPVQVKIGDSVLMIGGTSGGDHAAPATAHLYLLVDDVDASYKQALDAGATAVPGQVLGGLAAYPWRSTETVLNQNIMSYDGCLLQACITPPSQTFIVHQYSAGSSC